MRFGLNGNNNNEEHQRELLEIEAIYRKYDPNNLYSPLGFASADIKDKKNGWFFDGWPLNATGYANSPQWFSYFCGKSYIYFDDIPEEKSNLEDQLNELLNKLSKDNLKNLNKEDMSKKLAYYMSELNVLHPFREGNGRTIREFIRELAFVNRL